MNENIVCLCLLTIICIRVGKLQSKEPVKRWNLLLNSRYEFLITTFPRSLHQLVPSVDTDFCTICFVYHNSVTLVVSRGHSAPLIDYAGTHILFNSSIMRFTAYLAFGVICRCQAIFARLHLNALDFIRLIIS